MSQGLVIAPITFIGKVYVYPAEAKDNHDVYVCLDSKEKEGIVLKIFSEMDIGEAQCMAYSLNEWAAK
jgi:hypothetical protein